MLMNYGLVTSSILVTNERKKRSKSISVLSDCMNEQDKFAFSLAKELANKLEQKFKVLGPFGLVRKNTILFYDSTGTITTKVSVIVDVKTNTLACSVNEQPYSPVNSLEDMKSLIDCVNCSVLAVS